MKNLMMAVLIVSWTFGVAHSEGLPDGYTELEFIRGTGEQYLDTKVTATEFTRLVMKFAYTITDKDGGGIGYGASGSAQSFRFWRSIDKDTGNAVYNVNIDDKYGNVDGKAEWLDGEYNCYRVLVTKKSDKKTTELAKGSFTGIATNATVIHSAVYDFYGWNSTTARGEVSNAVNTAAFTRYWKGATKQWYLPEMPEVPAGVDPMAEFARITTDVTDCNGNRVDDGYELYIRYATFKSDDTAAYSDDLARCARGQNIGHVTFDPYAVLVWDTDDNGNKTVIDQWQFTVDEESDKPVSEIHLPEEMQVVTADFVISGIVYDDDGPCKIFYRIDKDEYKQVEENASSFKVNIPLLSLTDNEHTISVYGIDVNGVKGDEFKRVFRVSLEEPKGAMTLPEIKTTVKELKGKNIHFQKLLRKQVFE